jgi:cardiolipin synthase
VSASGVVPAQAPGREPGEARRSSRSALGARTVGAHEVTLLRNGRELFPSMLDELADAKKTVALEMYWIEDDDVGRTFRAALAECAARGVDVRVVVDGFGSAKLPRDFFDVARRAGVRVRTFRPLFMALEPLRPRGVLARDHRKVLVVDDRVAFVGGVNLCSTWSPIGLGGADWRDTAVRVEGPELPAHLRALFDASWARASGARERGHDAADVWTAEGGRIGVLANTPELRRRRKIRQAYLWGLRRAQKSVDITCAYFAPRRVFLRALRQAIRRGVRVRLLLPLESDVWLADVLASSWVRVLSAMGAEVYGYAGSVLHAKSAIFDARWVTVGSHNLDALSWAYNLECNVFVEDEGFGRDATEQFEEDLLLSVRLPRPSRFGVTDSVADAFAAAMESLYALGL